MKVYAPKYYQRFECIADKCKHSCCIGWEIDVDSDSLEKYNSLDSAKAKPILDSIDTAGEPKFKLTKGQRCSNLDENGLCKIIKFVGSDYLCDICREHPRFYNFTNRGKELGIGMACEEACRIILSSDDFDEMIEIGEADGEPEIYQFDAAKNIEAIYSGLKSEPVNLLKEIGLLYDCYDIEIDFPNTLKIVEELEYLDPAHKTLFLSYKQPEYPLPQNNKELSRAFAYFIYRHCSEALDGSEFSTMLNFSIFCTLLLAGLSEGNVYDNARILSEEIEYSDVNKDRILIGLQQPLPDSYWSDI